MVRRSPALWSLAGAALIACGLIGACSASGKTETFGAGGETSTGAGAGKASSSSGTGGSSSGTGGSSSGAGGFDFDAGFNDAADAMPCAADFAKAEQIPLDIFIMLDKSGSMSDSVPPGFPNTKWTAVTAAIKGFVQQPAAAGIGVGIQYFGLPPSCPASCVVDADCGAHGPCSAGKCNCPFGDSCDANDYSGAEVEIAPLPGVAQAIIDSMATHMPDTATPTSAALDGAIKHAKGWQNAHPTHVTIVVLATDGDPSECVTDLAKIDAIAGAGYGSVPKILTFVIGVGSSLSALNGIAMAGGTDTAFLVDTNQNVNQQFLDAMNKIRASVLGCEYLIPLPEAGMPDFNKVNVQFTPGSGGNPFLFPKVDNKASCPKDSDGWYYDNNANPTKIEMCFYSCSRLTADINASIEILTGCQSVIN